MGFMSSDEIRGDWDDVTEPRPNIPDPNRITSGSLCWFHHPDEHTWCMGRFQQWYYDSEQERQLAVVICDRGRPLFVCVGCISFSTQRPDTINYGGILD